jgi:hypothetical protein
MILRTTLQNKIRELKYTLFKETKRVHIWRKKGSAPPHYIPIQNTNKLEDEYVKSALSQAGMKDADIKTFIDLHAVPEND